MPKTATNKKDLVCLDVRLTPNPAKGEEQTKRNHNQPHKKANRKIQMLENATQQKN